MTGRSGVAGGRRRRWVRGALAGGLALVLATGAVTSAGAEVGDTDPAFGVGGVATGPPGSASGLVVLADGSVVAAGTTAQINFNDFRVVRFRPDGSLDPAFGDSGVRTTDFGTPDTAATGSTELAAAVALQDGKIVVAGNSEGVDVAVARYLADGSPDPSFGDAGRVLTDLGGAEAARAVTVQQGRIVVGGLAFQTDGTADFLLIRYLDDGTLDTTFGGDGVVTTDLGDAYEVRALAVQTDGKLVAAGCTGQFSCERFAVARYDTSGNLDASFNAGGTRILNFGGADGGASAVAVDGTGRIVLAGSVMGDDGDIAVARLTSTGANDATFDDGSVGAGRIVTSRPGEDQVSALTLQSDDAVVVAGSTANDADPDGTDFLVARYQPDGSLDPAFGEAGVMVTDFRADDELRAVAIVPPGPAAAGKAVAAGASDGRFALVRYESADLPTAADLRVSVTDSPDPVRAGEPLTYRVTVVNAGSAPAYRAVVSDALPAGVVFVSATPAAGRGACREAGGLVTCGLLSMAPGASATVAFTVIPSVAGELVNAPRASTPSEPSGLQGDNAVTVTTAVTPGTGRWLATGSLVEGRTGHTATMLPDGRVLVAGGATDGDVPAASADLYDPRTGAWVPTGRLSAARTEHTASLLPDGTVLVTGGMDRDLNVLRTTERYSPVTGAWSAGPDLRTERRGHSATVLSNGQLLVVGGFLLPSALACNAASVPLSAEVFNPDTGASATPAEPFATMGHTATALRDGRVLVVGGTRGFRFETPHGDCAAPSFLAPARLFDPATGAWSVPAAPVVRRIRHSATPLDDGRVLVVGGTPCGGGGCPTTAAEVFDPATGGWSAASPLTTARSQHTATRLPGGKVVVAGGEGVLGLTFPALSTAELYDPVAEEWGSAGLLTVPRLGHSATLLAEGPTEACADRCGRVLVVGGTDNVTVHRSAELYAPVPAVVSLTPGSGPSTGGTTVTINGTGLAGATDVRFGSVPAASWSVASSGVITAVSPAHVAGVVDVTVATPGGISPASSGGRFSFTGDATGGGAGAESSVGYWLVASDGGVFAFGDARFLGSTGALRLAQPVVGMAATPSGRGYWLVAADGGVFAFGDAPFLGSTGALRLNRPVVGMAATPTGRGYWLVASDGGVFAFGDARFLGSTASLRLAQPVVGMAPTPTGRGYWMVAADGGVFAFGDAPFLGSTGALRLNRPVVGVAATPTGRGYWLVASDGGVFAFGDGRFLGSTGSLRLAQPVVGMAATPTGRGYRLVAADGGVFAFGDAPFRGSTGALRLNRPVVGAAGT